jgi:hypothetical protein
MNGYLLQEWFTLGNDSVLRNTYQYDLLNENKEAAWKE